MSGDVRVSNPGGTSIYDALMLAPEKPVQKPQPKAEEKPAQIQTKDNNSVATPTGKKDAPNVNLVDQKPKSESTKSMPLVNSDTGDVLKFKTDAKGLPVLNNQGQLQPDDKGKAVFVKVNDKDEPVTDEDGELIFVESAGKIPASNVSLTDSKPQPKSESTKSMPLVNSDTGDVLKFKTDAKGLPVLNTQGQLQPDDKGKAVFVKVNDKDEPVTDKDGGLVFVEESKVTAPQKPQKDVQAQSTTENAPAAKDSGKVAPLINQETGEVLKLKVDAKGIPVLGEDGKLQPDPKGKPVFVKLDEKGEPLVNEKGEPQFVGAEGQPMPEMPPQVKTAMAALETHSAKRLLTGFGYKSMAMGLATKGSNILIKGVSVQVAGKAFGFGVKHAVAKAATAELVKITAAAATKAGTTTVVAAAKVATTSATVGTIKALTTAGKLGKGLEAVAIPTIIKSLKAPVLTTKAVVESSKALTSVVKGGTKVYAAAVKSTVVGAGEVALKKGIEKGIEKGLTAAVSRAGVGAVEKVTTKATEKALEKVVTAAATKAATTGTAKAGTKIASAVPIIGAIAGAAIVAYDAHDAYKKFKDPKATNLSRGLAVATVALGTISTIAKATGIGAPIGWIATGLSIGTSVASDYYRYKKEK